MVLTISINVSSNYVFQISSFYELIFITIQFDGIVKLSVGINNKNQDYVTQGTFCKDTTNWDPFIKMYLCFLFSFFLIERITMYINKRKLNRNNSFYCNTGLLYGCFTEIITFILCSRPMRYGWYYIHFQLRK